MKTVSLSAITTLLSVCVLLASANLQDQSGNLSADKTYQEPVIFVGNLFEDDARMFVRFAKMNGVQCGLVSSGTIVQIEHKETNESMLSLLKAFRYEYGVDFINTVDFSPQLNSPVYRVKLPRDISVAQFLLLWSDGSVMKAACLDAIRRKDVAESDLIVEYDYTIRPWLSEDYKKSERMDGSLTIRMPGTHRKVLLKIKDGGGKGCQ